MFKYAKEKQMKTLIFSISALFLSCVYSLGNAQGNREVRLISSVIINDEVFNYEYNLSSNQMNTLYLEKVTGAKSIGQTPFGIGLDSVKKNLEEAGSKLNLDDNGVKVINEIITSISARHASNESFINQSTKDFDSLITIITSAIKGSSLSSSELDSVNSAVASVTKLNSQLDSRFRIDKKATFATFNIETIRKIVNDQLKINYGISLTSKELDSLSQKLYYEISTRKNFFNDQPSTAFLRLRKDLVNVYFQTDTPETQIAPLSMRLVSVTLEFEAGTIKNIEAILENSIANNVQIVKFRNNMPISITNKFTMEKLWKTCIFAANPEMIYLPSDSKTDLKSNIETKKFNNAYFRAGELLQYDVILANYREDYSPRDIVVSLSPQQTVVELKKQERAKILSVKTFTDLNGINSEQPNGLIQIEASLAVNLLTYRWQKVLFIPSKKIYQGFLTKAELIGHLAKIEENNKNLTLGIENAIPPLPTSNNKLFQILPIDIYRYRNSGVDFHLNLYKLNLPAIMSNFQVNGSFGIIRTGFIDSLKFENNVYTKTSTQYEWTVTSKSTLLQASFDFMPEERYSFKVSLSNMWINPLHEQVNFSSKVKNQIRIISFEGFINLNEDNTSKIFFRWRLNSQASMSNRNFNQVQVGYLVDLFGTKK
jgi:hypothetical protein